jgi:hypothetical protein
MRLRMAARHGAVGAGLVLVVALAACGEATIDTDKAESAIRSGITRQTGVKIDAVRCPDDVEAREGDTFRCLAQASNGQRARVEVTQRDDEAACRGVCYRSDKLSCSEVQDNLVGDDPGRRSTRGRHVASALDGP